MLGACISNLMTDAEYVYETKKGRIQIYEKSTCNMSNRGALVISFSRLRINELRLRNRQMLPNKRTTQQAARKNMPLFLKTQEIHTAKNRWKALKMRLPSLGGEPILKAPDQPTAEAQIKMIEELISQKVASIAIVGNDPDALQPALKKAMTAGIKVFPLIPLLTRKAGWCTLTKLTLSVLAA